MMKNIPGLILNIVVHYVTLRLTPAEMMTPRPWNISHRALGCCSNAPVKANDWNSTILSQGIKSSQCTQWHLSNRSHLTAIFTLLERRNCNTRKWGVFGMREQDKRTNTALLSKLTWHRSWRQNIPGFQCQWYAQEETFSFPELHLLSWIAPLKLDVELPLVTGTALSQQQHCC